ncbi:MAG: hypothetical protein JXR58_12750 [Bacteroidales bacterium]|nr:hypothetical protein [Bacteroidales bacterium]
MLKNENLRKFFLLVFLFTIFISFSQDVKRSAAYTHFKNGDLEKAKEVIDEVCLHSETSNQAKTWYFKGLIYNGIARKNQNSFESDKLSNEALQAIIKAGKLDNSGTYRDQIEDVLLNISLLFYNNGVLRYNKGLETNNKESYKYSLLDFENFFETIHLLGSENTEIKDVMQRNSIDINTVRFYAGFSAAMTENFEKAKIHFENIVKSGGGVPQAYTNYCDILLAEGNKEDALRVVEQAKQLWPADDDIELMKLRVYQQTGKTGVLTDDIEKALLKDPNNVSLLSALADAYNKISYEYKTQGDNENYRLYREKAEINFLKAIENKQESDELKFDLHYNLGVLFFNPGVEVYNIWVKNQTDEIKGKYILLFNKCIIQFEKALEIQPENSELIDMMMRVYLILENEDKALSMKEKLNNLKK